MSTSAQDMFKRICAEVDALVKRNTPNIRAIRRRYSKMLRAECADCLFDLAQIFLHKGIHRWVAYELIRCHPAAYPSLNEEKLEQLGQGINSWWTVDSFARTLAGPAWRDGLVEDHLIERWAHSADLWWRRAALVSTVALNLSSQGGKGDSIRTLAICRLLAADHEDLVAKALSWALRELVVHDREGVKAFLKDHEAVLAAQVKREVGNKLESGFKNPRKKGQK